MALTQQQHMVPSRATTTPPWAGHGVWLCIVIQHKVKSVSQQHGVPALTSSPPCLQLPNLAALRKGRVTST
jgi:hypothetical protein